MSTIVIIPAMAKIFIIVFAMLSKENNFIKASKLKNVPIGTV